MANGINKFENFTDERDRFIPSDSDRKKTLKSVRDRESIKSAVEYGYIDACRTMSGIKKYEDKKNTAIDAIVTKLLNYFTAEPAPTDENTFDEKHEEMCKNWTDAFDDNNISTCGKAQKIVNMAFKYLYCCGDADNHNEYFKFCHVPLDSITLEWFYRKLKEEDAGLTRDSILPWSKIEEYGDLEDKDACMNEAHEKDGHSYMYFQNYFRKWFEGQDKITPLQAEFIYWPLTQETLAAEAFLKSLTDEGDNSIGKPISADNKKAIYAEIKKHI